ncbi:MAG: hypothetical protein WBO70_06840 [Erysipelotrichaceae bacterium]
MGSIESAINSILLFVPGLVTIGLVYIASNFSIIYVSIALGLFLILTVVLAISMDFKFEVVDKEHLSN